jgi:hypothetical protein
LATTAGRTGWQALANIWMLNNVHLFLKTPQPNFSLGMQYVLGKTKVGENKTEVSFHEFF